MPRKIEDFGLFDRVCIKILYITALMWRFWLGSIVCGLILLNWIDVKKSPNFILWIKICFICLFLNILLYVISRIITKKRIGRIRTDGCYLYIPDIPKEF